MVIFSSKTADQVTRTIGTLGLHISTIVGCLAWVASLAGCGNPPYPRGSIDQLFSGSTAPNIGQEVVRGQVISVARVQAKRSISSAGNIALLFVHGSPGDWKAWSYYLKTPELAGFATRVAVDRPGFGASQGSPVMTDLRRQAAMLSALIPVGQKAIVVGHSLGGPLVAWMAIDAPDKVCGAVSIAGSLSSRFEEPRWYNLLADSALLGWTLPKEMARSNQEMMPLSEELVKLEAAMGQLRTPLLLIQGGKDSLVDPRTVDEVEKRVPSDWLKVVRLPNESHFVLWDKPQIVVDAIKNLSCASSP